MGISLILGSYFAFSHYWKSIIKLQGSKELTFWKKAARNLTLSAKNDRCLAHSVLAGLEQSQVWSSTKGKFSDLPRLFIEVVMIEEHNKREILAENRGDRGDL